MPKMWVGIILCLFLLGCALGCGSVGMQAAGNILQQELNPAYAPTYTPPPKKIFIYPTYPGTNVRDYSKPGVIIENGISYPTFPGTDIPDYSQPGGWGTQ